MNVAYSELLKLPLSEKLQLLEDLWESIAANPDQVPVPEGLIEELDRRKEEYELNPGIGRSWEDVQASIRARYA